MSMKQFYLGVTLTSLSFVLFATKVDAAVQCQPIYGGGETCIQVGKVTIDKKVEDPALKGNFKDTLSINDNRYFPEQAVTFRLIVTNTTDQEARNIVVQDVLPELTSFVEGPGEFDRATKTLTIKVNSMKANEQRTFTIVGRVAAASDLPQAQAIPCVVNRASVKADGMDKANEDNAQFCIEQRVVTTTPGQPGAQQVPGETKGGLKVFPPVQTQQTPKTGPEMLGLIGLIPSGALGWFLRRKTK